MNRRQRPYSGNLGMLRWACAALLAGILPALAGPKEDGDAAFNAGKMAAAEAAYTQALAEKPDDALALIGRGRARQNLGNRADAAADFESAVAIAPGNSEAWRGRGLSRYFAKDLTGALADLDKAVELDSQSALALENRAVVHVALKDYMAAVIDCTRAVQIKPDYVTGYSERGLAFQRLNDQNSALRDFETVIKLEPRNTYALTRRAMIYEARGDKEKAAQEYRFVLAVDPKQRDAATHLAALEMAGKTAPGPSSGANPQLAADSAAAKGAKTPAPMIQGTAPARSAIVGAANSQSAAPVSAVSTAVQRTESAASTGSVSQATAPSSPSAPDSSSSSVAYHGPPAAPKSAEPNGPNSKASAPAGPKGPAAPAPQSANMAANKPQTTAAPSTVQAGAAQPMNPDQAPTAKRPLPSAGYYKLVKVEMPPEGDAGTFCQRSADPKWFLNTAMNPLDPADSQSDRILRGGYLQGSGTDANWTFFCKLDYNNLNPANYIHRAIHAPPLAPQWKNFQSKLHWSVPPVLVPGEPAPLHLDSSISEGSEYLDHVGTEEITGKIGLFTGNYAKDLHAGEAWLGQDTSTVVVIQNYRMPDPRGRGPARASDDFSIKLPDLASLFQQYQSGGGKTDLKASIHLPAGDYEEQLKYWPGYLQLVVGVSDLFGSVNTTGGIYSRMLAAAPVAVYTYQWVGPPDIPGSLSNPLEVVIQPGPKTSIRADGRDGVYVRAHVKAKDASEAAAALTATSGIAFSGEGANAGWVDLPYKPEVRDGWQVAMVQASNPDAARGGGNQLPATVTVMAHAMMGGQPWTQTLNIPVAPNAEINTAPDKVELTSQSGEAVKVTLAIDNAGPDPWEFHADYGKESRKVAKAEINPVDGKSATLTLTEAGLDPLHDGSNREQAILKITAEQKGSATLEHDLKVSVFQEGLFVSTVGRDPEKGIFLLNGDGKAHAPAEIDVRVYAKDPKTKKIVNLTAKEESLKKLSVTRLDPKGSAASNILDAGKYDGSFSRVRQVNDPAAVLSLTLPKEVPADGRIVPCDLRISYAGGEGASYSSIITIGVVTTGDGPGGSNWQVELDRCQEVITKFVPAAYYPKMQALLDRRKMTLGSQGLAELRHKIWNAAAELTLGEGGEGYANEAAWAGAITGVLEWSQWAGDMAFNAAIGSLTGPYGAAGAGMLKGLVVSGINAYQDGESPEQWLWENVTTLPGMIEGQVVDPSKFQQWGMKSKAWVWSLYVSYHFVKNLYMERSLVEALKDTAKDVGENVLGSWLGEEVQKHGNMSVSSWAGAKSQQVSNLAAGLMPKAPAQSPAAESTPKPPSASGTEPAGNEAARTPAKETAAAKPAAEEPPPGPPKPDASAAPEPTPAQESDAAALVRSRTTEGPDGTPSAHVDDVIAIMKDPTMVRALKNAPPEVQEAFSNTRERIYEQHDAAVVQYIRDTMPGMAKRMVKVKEFRTPGATGPSLNTDRDYRVCYFAGWDNNNLEQWVEVPRKYWQATSYETFGQLTGCPKDYKGGNEKWAVDHQQLATDKSHEEASVAFSDQRYVFNETTKHYERIAVVSNIVQVLGDQQKQKWNPETHGWDTVPEDPSLAQVAKPTPDDKGIDLKDPQGLGLMYQVKVQDARQPQEAFVQANKAVETLVALRKEYNLQGRDIGTLAPSVEAGMKAVAEVTAKLKADPNCRDPKAVADAEKTLRANGFPSIGAFMDKLGGQFEAFKNM